MSTASDGSVLKNVTPVIFGYLPVAITFGLLANQQQLGIALTLALSAFVYAGASQFVGLTLLATGYTAFAPVFLTIWLVNLRHFILSLAYLPQTSEWSLLSKLRFFPFLTDETFAVLMSTKKMKRDSSQAFAVAILSYGTWVTGSAIGFYSGEFVPDPKKFGLDFALTAMFVGIIVLFIKKRSHLVTLVTTLLLSLVFYGIFDAGKNSVLLAALLGSGLGWYAGREKAVA